MRSMYPQPSGGMTVMSEVPQEIIDPPTADDGVLKQVLARQVKHQHYPCLGARSVFLREEATMRVYDELADPASAHELLGELRQFAAVTDPAAGFASFVALFRGPVITSEPHFEQLLWSQLRQLHEVDEEGWNEAVSPNPADEHFAFSVAGTAYFIVGLHPRASRLARRTPMPALVFNLHEQFELLRGSGRFAQLRDRIRERDKHLQGTINPMVSDHGVTSEAVQYSGRRVEPAWEAPFRADGHACQHSQASQQGQAGDQKRTL